MTHRHVVNRTRTTRIRHVHSETFENQKDNVGKLENSPRMTSFDNTQPIIYKANDYRRVAAQESDPASSPPLLIAEVPDFSLTQDVLMAPYDFSDHFAGVAITGYTLTATPTGLAFDTATGILSGTPTAAGSTNPIVSAVNANGTTGSNVFNISVSA